MKTCHALATKIETMQPEATLKDVARLCLLLANEYDEKTQLKNEDGIAQAWQEMSLKLQAATDQHAAMTEELEELAQSNPEEFTHDQIWILIRAIKVQSQILQMYVGHAVLDA